MLMSVLNMNKHIMKIEETDSEKGEVVIVEDDSL